MKSRHMILALGVLIAGGLAIFGDKTPNNGVAEAVVTPAKREAKPVTNASIGASASVPQPASPTERTSADNGRRNDKRELVILALRDRQDLIGGANAANKDSPLFGVQSWVPPPPPPPKPAPPPPPTAPALPFTYIGKKLEDAAWEVYLTQGEHTIIVHEKSLIEQTYRIDSIKPPTMTLTYLPLNQMQTLTIGEDE